MFKADAWRVDEQKKQGHKPETTQKKKKKRATQWALCVRKNLECWQDVGGQRARPQGSWSDSETSPKWKQTMLAHEQESLPPRILRARVREKRKGGRKEREGEEEKGEGERLKAPSG